MFSSKAFTSRRTWTTIASTLVGAGTATYFFLPDTSRSAPTSAQQHLSASHFTPTRVTSTEPSGPDTRLICLTVPPHLLPSRDRFAAIWSVFIKDDDIQVERPYTPLEGVDDQGRMLFWIKKYPKGEVGRWLHSKNVGDNVELRGPLTTWPWKEDVWDEVVMISGGTGITPFYQLFHNVIKPGSSSRTRFTLLHSSRTPADLPPPAILQPLISYAAQNTERFSLHLFVDSRDPTPAKPQLEVGRIGKQAIEKALGIDHPNDSWWTTWFRSSHHATEDNAQKDRKVLFLVCGPDQMISAIAGPFGRNFSQGLVGGVLGEMGYTSNQVRKL